MNTFNRVVIVILLLIAIVACTISSVLPIRTVDTLSRQLDGLADFFERLRPIIRIPLGILVALTLDVVFVLLIILEIRRRAPKSIQVEQTSGGEVKISVASIADRLNYEVDQLPGVLRSKSSVAAKRGGVTVELDVEMAAKLDVPQKAEQIVETARRVVEETMGLKLSQPPKVNLRAVPHPKEPKKKQVPTPDQDSLNLAEGTTLEEESGGSLR